MVKDKDEKNCVSYKTMMSWKSFLDARLLVIALM